MVYKAYIRHVRISPKKLRFIVDDVRKMLPREALNALYYSNKRAGKILYKAIKSAVDNSKKEPKVDPELLRFKILTIKEGPSLKRFRAGARGTAKPYKRRTSHIKVVLEAKEELEKKKKVEKRREEKKRGKKEVKSLKKAAK